MTTPTTRRRGADPRAVRRERLRAALTADARLNSTTLLATALLCTLTLVLSLLWSDALSALLPLWAALAWYRYGRHDTMERRELLAVLGISRADRVRGRVALVALDSLTALVTIALSSVLSRLRHGESSAVGPIISFQGEPAASWPSIESLNVVFTAAALVAVGIAMGGACVTRRPGVSHAVLLALYLFLVSFVLGLPGGLVLLPLGHTGQGLERAYWVGALLYLCVTGILLLVLRARIRRWIRILDAPVR